MPVSNFYSRSFILSCFLILSACGKGSSFSLLSETETFTQAVSVFNNKIDIIWMVDDSGTMANHQSNLANNFNAFIGDFVEKEYDYNMVVGSTDAWVRDYNYNIGGCVANPNSSEDPNKIYTSSADCKITKATYGEMARFRDGDIYGQANGTAGVRSGNYLITSLMLPNQVMNLFSINVRTGTRGDGNREAGYQSLRALLRRNTDGTVGYGGETHTVLNSFRRSDAFFAVIFISDEEDQSRKSDRSRYASIDDYVTEFTAFLDGYTGGTLGNRRYNVSSIVLEDIDNCTYGLNGEATQGDKYVAIARATNGIVGNICSTDFSSQLTAISDRIATLSTRFQFSREPIPESIVVTVNGVNVPQDALNGWTYVQDNGFHYIEFHGAAVPPQAASISVHFDPRQYGS